MTIVNTTDSTRTGRWDRRGNTLVLVSGILVLLVIIATAYVSRSRAERVTAGAVQDLASLDAKNRSIGQAIAGEFAQSLFVRPVDTTLDMDQQRNSNQARLRIDPTAVRHGLDTNVDFNFAPWETIPWTNWPDPPDAVVDGVSFYWPAGAGNPGGGAFSPLLDGEDNPEGNPGFGDNRLMSDIEPMRSIIDPGGPSERELFTHWRHMSYIAHANNGFRHVYDISNVMESLVDGIVSSNGFDDPGLLLPPEQFLATPPSLSRIGTGGQDYDVDWQDFVFDWRTWCIDWEGHGEQLSDPDAIPLNFIRLSDIDGDGFYGEAFPGERPQDEFKGIGDPDYPNGAARWHISRVLADADGDGYTDSFWFLAPTPVDGDIKQVVAMRVIDNCGMLNVNTATRFVPNNVLLNRGRTRGWGPSDIALVGENQELPASVADFDNYNVGYYDSLINREFNGFFGRDFFDPYSTGGSQVDVSYRWDSWAVDPDGNSHADYTNLDNISNTGELNQVQRLDYFRRAGLRPFDPLPPFTPYGIPEELELRMFAGQNHPWILSRFEKGVQKDTGSGDEQFVHASTGREETSELLDQNQNRELLFDHRHRMTMINSVRHDEMPPWLWPTVNESNQANRQKIDLRSGDENAAYRTGIYQRLTRALGDPVMDKYYYDSSDDPFGSSGRDVTEKMAASLTANMMAYRDRDGEPLTIRESVGRNAADQSRYIGMERQPFLLEAFVAHTYKSIVVPAVDGNGEPYDNEGHNVIVDDSGKQSTICVVQIANPYDRAIDLYDYKMSVFGRVFDLAAAPNTLFLQPGTPENPVTAIVYSIAPTLDGDTEFRSRWVDFLDIEDSDHPSDTIIINRTGSAFGGTQGMSTSRSTYDSFSGDQAIELIRKVQFDADPDSTADVVVDRFDDENHDSDMGSFTDAVKAMADVDRRPPMDPGNPPGGIGVCWGPGIDLGKPDPLGGDTFTHWTSWVRVTRAWGADWRQFPGDTLGTYDRDERNPRYVFSHQAVVEPANTAGATNFRPALTDGGPGCPRSPGPIGHAYTLGADPDTPWIARNYFLPNGLLPTTPRKPTFFDMDRTLNVTGTPNFPDKGWYSQPDGVDGPVLEVDGAGLPETTFELDFPMQMLQKDGDFEQVGEILNVFLWGHELEVTNVGDPPTIGYAGTRVTFSEQMFLELKERDVAEEEIFVNRLNVDHAVLGVETPAYANLPAGLRVFDAFVCDGSGLNPGDLDLDGSLDTSTDFELARFGNAAYFQGRGVPGLINLNTAPREVKRALPFFERLVHVISPEPSAPTGLELPDNPRVAVAGASEHYIERFNGDAANQINHTGIPGGPDYTDRAADIIPDGTDADRFRGRRGMATAAELLLLRAPGQATIPAGKLPEILPQNWRSDLGVMDGFSPYPNVDANEFPVSTLISTDVTNPVDNTAPNPDLVARIPDNVALDSEEANLLYSGVSNMVTTRSDMVTIYFKVRTFRQNPTTLIWDATNPEYILDESRYVMLVDRSEVNSPSDSPRIVYMEKLPR